MKSLISSMVGCFASGGCDFVAMVGFAGGCDFVTGLGN